MDMQREAGARQRAGEHRAETAEAEKSVTHGENLERRVETAFSGRSLLARSAWEE
jgi:hypothetical protein